MDFNDLINNAFALSLYKKLDKKQNEKFDDLLENIQTLEGFTGPIGPMGPIGPCGPIGPIGPIGP